MIETWKTKVHKVTVLIVDHDDLGFESIKCEMENVRYPKRCISASVMDIETVEVDYNDKHPINGMYTRGTEFMRLFTKK